MALQADTTLLIEKKGGRGIWYCYVISKKDMILDKGYTCVCFFFFFFCNSENKKKASVKLKCNGVQFKCNTVNSKKVKTASS